MADVEFLHKCGVVMGDVEFDVVNRYAHLGRLIVKPKKMRRQGVGRELHDWFEVEALRWGNIAIITSLAPDRTEDLEATRSFLVEMGYSLIEYKGEPVYRKIIQQG